MKKLNFGLGALLFCVSLSLQAASFDCKKVTTAIEKGICNTVELSDYDERMAYAYGQLLKTKSASSKQFTIDQRNWIKKRDKNCSDGKPSCLSPLYADRIEMLENDLVRMTMKKAKGSCKGVYSLPHLVSAPKADANNGDVGVAFNDLMIDPLDKTHISFSLMTIGTNGHSCHVEGIAQQQKEGFHWQATQSLIGNEKSEKCKIQIRLWEKENYASVDFLNNDETTCQQNYCGMRAYFHRAGEVYIAANQRLNKKSCENERTPLGN